MYRKPPHVSFVRAHDDTPGAVRVDDGVRQGDAISPFYDSMIAKLIVHGDTREQALARLDAALAQTHIVGLQTNVQFLRRVVRSDAFAQARLDTALIQREEATLFKQEPLGLALTAAAVVAHTLQTEQGLQDADPFSRRDGWRAYGQATRRFGFVFHGEAVEVVLTYGHDGRCLLTVDDTPAELRWQCQGDALSLHWGEQALHAQVYVQHEGGEDVAHVFTPQGATRITVVDALAHAGDTHEAGGRLSAPMPGKVVSFFVKAGDKVQAGQPLAVMEAMKMEHTIAAPADGEVAELLFAPGDQVAEGDELLRLNV